MIAAKALPLYQAEARKRQKIGAEMTHQQLGPGHKTEETLPPITAEGFTSLPKKTKSKNEKESSYQAEGRRLRCSSVEPASSCRRPFFFGLVRKRVSTIGAALLIVPSPCPETPTRCAPATA